MADEPENYVVRVRNEETQEWTMIETTAADPLVAMEHALHAVFAHHGWTRARAIRLWRQIPLPGGER